MSIAAKRNKKQPNENCWTDNLKCMWDSLISKITKIYDLLKLVYIQKKNKTKKIANAILESYDQLN